MMKVVILTFEGFESAMVINYLLKNQKKFKITYIIKSSTFVYQKNLFYLVQMITNGVSIEFILFKLFQSLIWRFSLFLKKDKSKIKPIQLLKRKYKFDLIKTKDINNPFLIQTIEKMRPDILLSVFFNQKIGNSVLKLSRVASINLHPALLPAYRGLFPYFWVLARDEKSTGVTVHIMDERFDSGKILGQRKIRIKKDDTAFSLNFRCAREGSKLLVQILEDMKNTMSKGKLQNNRKMSYFSWPKNKDLRILKERKRQLFSIREFWQDT